MYKNHIVNGIVFVSLIMVIGYSPLLLLNKSITVYSQQQDNVLPDTEWTKFSSSGISFDYPSTWKVEYPSYHEILISNPAEPYNAFLIGLPIHSNTDPSNNMVDLANSIFPENPGITIIEPFTEHFIAGSYAAMGKVQSKPEESNTTAISNSIFINHNGQVFFFHYSNVPEKFDDYDSQQTMNHIISSLRFT